jgi:hypothetical protein
VSPLPSVQERDHRENPALIVLRSEQEPAVLIAHDAQIEQKAA